MTEVAKPTLSEDQIKAMSQRFLRPQEKKDGEGGNIGKVIQKIENGAEGAENKDERPVISYTDEPAKENKEDKTDKTEKPQFNYGRFKDFVGKDEIADDDIYEAVKTREEKIKDYEAKLAEKDQKIAIVKEGKGRLANNEQYKYYDWVSGLNNEEAVKHGLAVLYVNDGLDEKQALTKAQKRFEEDFKGKEGAIEDYAINVRNWGKEQRQGVVQKVEQELENSVKDVNLVVPTKEFEAQVKAAQEKFDDFLGMRISSDDKERKKILDKAYKSPEQVNQMLKDPQTLLEVMYFLEYKDVLKKNIANRTNGKADAIQRFAKQASGSGGLGSRIVDRSKGAGGGSRPAPTDGVGFTGKAK